MRDPAKTDARKGARVQKNVAHKVGVLLRGKAYVYPERIMFENIQYLAWAIEHKERLTKTGQHTEKELRLLYNEAVKWAQDSLADAIIDNDVGFFERMADLARLKMDAGLIQSGKALDDKGAKVSGAAIVLRVLKRPVNGDSIAEYLNERWPKAKKNVGCVKGDKTPIMEGGAWDGGEVRKIMTQIGLKADTKRRLVS